MNIFNMRLKENKNMPGYMRKNKEYKPYLMNR